MRYAVLLMGMLLFADCTPKKVVHMDFNTIREGELPAGWIVSQTNKSFPAIWEVNEKKQLFIKYPRGYKYKEKNIFFTKDYYFKNGFLQATLLAKENGGLIFRAKDRKHYYSLLLDFAHNKIVLESINDKSVKKIYEQKIKLSKVPSILGVKYCDSDITLYLNKRVVANVKDNSLSGPGGVGLIGCGGSVCVYDDIEIKVFE